ncbi:hypothetical protein AB0C97_36005, partial [Streptomyces goshikiensis]|uniref:hypothetical protein n=1 Tax=Streptomyces goshikiensis TaxID=1942 RepID=UPI0033DF77CB
MNENKVIAGHAGQDRRVGPPSGGADRRYEVLPVSVSHSTTTFTVFLRICVRGTSVTDRFRMSSAVGLALADLDRQGVRVRADLVPD